MAHDSLSSLFSDIADSIRSKTSSSETIVADNFPSAIDAIVTDPSGDATATAADILSPKTAYAGGAKVTGTMANNGAATATINTQGGTYNIPAGYHNGSGVITATLPSGTVNSPVATKGTVSNHSIVVTPSVSNTAGYVSADSKTGTAVTVSASELVSGTLTVTANGTSSCVNYENVTVAIPVYDGTVS